MILGIGTDIVEIQRIKNAVEKWGEGFLKKVFTEEEILYCYKRKNPYPHLAVRFAAKEAVIKAVGSRLTKDSNKLQVTSNKLKEDNNSENSLLVTRYSLLDIEILNEATGKPFINLTGSLTAFTNKLILHLTMSHERNYAIAMVVLERKET